MIQRIQTVYLLLITVLTVVTAIMSKNILYCLLFAIPGVISLITVFLYKNRKMQMLTGKILLITLIFLWWYICFIAWHVLHFTPDIPTAIMFFTSMISVILAYLSVRAIQKDEKLVRSLDRLR
jgi:hypothetical protein